MKELANPLVMHRTKVRLEFREGWQATITETKLDAAVDLLTKAGRAAQAAELCSKRTVTLDLVRDADACLALKEGLKIGPWRFIGPHAVAQRTGERDSALGHAPAPGRAPTPEVPTALKLGSEMRLLQGPDGHWHCGGCQYALMAKHVQDFWQTELAYPGHHRKQIAAFRNALDYAPQAPAGLVVEIDVTKTNDPF